MAKTKKAKRLKAYEVRESYEGHCCITFATNSATARREGACDLNTEWEGIESCNRAPWADQHAPGPVPLHETLAAGWWHTCRHCGCTFDSDGRRGEEEGDRDYECAPVRRSTNDYCSETCAQAEWVERAAYQARRNAVAEAATIRFPRSFVLDVYERHVLRRESKNKWCAALQVSGLTYPVIWPLGSETVDVSQCDVDAFKAWQKADQL